MKIEHIAMYFSDLEKAREFFMIYFSAVSDKGYYNSEKQFKSYFLTFDNGARLEIMNKPGLSDEDNRTTRYGYAHIAFSTGSSGEVDALTERLINDGYKVMSNPRTTGDGYYESCIVDFEGNLIEITI